MTTKIVSTSDLHIQGDRLIQRLTAIKQVIDFTIQEKADYLIVAGDIFDGKQIGDRFASTGTQTFGLNLLFEEVKQKSPETKIIVISGNHDRDNNREKAATEALKVDYHFDKPTYRDFGDGLDWLFLPWFYKDGKNSTSWFDVLMDLHDERDDMAKPLIIVGHMEIAGQTYKRFSDKGGNFLMDKLDIAALAPTAVMLGHIHQADEFYAGIPFQTDFRDEGCIPGFKFFKIEGPNHVSMIHIPIFGAVIHKTVEVKECSQINDELIAMSIDPEIKLRVKFHGQVEIPKALEKCSQRVVEPMQRRKTIETFDPGMNDTELLNNWYKENPGQTVSVDELVATMRELRV